MKKSKVKFKLSISKKLLIAKILGIAGGFLYFLTVIWIIIIFGSSGPQYGEDLIGVFGIFVFPFTGLISIVGGSLAPTHPGLAGWLLFVSGLIGLFLILGVPSGILLVIGAIFALSGRPDNYEADLVQVKNMIAARNFSEAMPRVFKLSRVNPDNPEVKLLIQKWRESKNNPDNRV